MTAKSEIRNQRSEGSEPDADIAVLNTKLATAEKERDGYQEAVKFQEARIHELRVENRALHEAVREKNWWAWQGDGHDHLESLICPILIRPEQLRVLLAAKERA